MLGWHITVSRQVNGGSLPATPESELGPPLAVWQARFRGLDWLEALVASGRAVALGGNGYPTRFTARVADVVPTVLAGPPEANAIWRTDPHDVVTDAWMGSTRIDRVGLAACAPDEWLSVVAFDES